MRGFVFVLLFFLVQCGGTQNKLEVVEQSSPTKPEWLYSIPEDSTYFYFVGISESAGQESKALELAKNHAIETIAIFLGARIESAAYMTYRTMEGELDDITFQALNEQITITCNQQIKGAWHLESFWQKYKTRERSEYYKYYVLMRLAKDQVEDTVKKVLESLLTSISDYSEQTYLEEFLENTSKVIDVEDPSDATDENPKELEAISGCYMNMYPPLVVVDSLLQDSDTENYSFSVFIADPLFLRLLISPGEYVTNEYIILERADLHNPLTVHSPAIAHNPTQSNSDIRITAEVLHEYIHTSEIRITIQGLTYGTNHFQLIERNHTDIETQIPLTITYIPEIPHIELDLTTPRTFEDARGIIKGICYAKHTIDKIYALPGNYLASIQVEEYKHHFTIRVPLEEGENPFELEALDEQGNQSSKKPISLIHSPKVIPPPPEPEPVRYEPSPPPVIILEPTQTFQVSDSTHPAVYPNAVFTDTSYGIVYGASYQGYDIYFTLYNKQGRRLKHPQRISTGSAYGLAASLNWNGTNFGTIWIDGSAGQNQLVFQRISESGESQGSNRRLAPAAVTLHSPVLLWGANQYMAIYVHEIHQHPQIHLLRFSENGDLLGEPIQLTYAGNGVSGPNAVWASNELGVTWIEERNQQDVVMFQRFTSRGRALGESTIVSQSMGHPLPPDLVWTGFGYGVVWDDNRHQQDQVFFCQLGLLGEKQQAETRISQLGVKSWMPSIVWGTHEYGVVYNAEVNGKTELYFSRINISGTLENEPVQVTDGIQSNWRPNLLWTNANYAVVWSDNRATQGRIYFAQ